MGRRLRRNRSNGLALTLASRLFPCGNFLSPAVDGAGAVLKLMLFHSRLSQMSDDQAGDGALRFKAAGAQAWEFSGAAVDMLGDHGKNVADMRMAHGTSPAPMQHELNLRIAAEKLAIAQIRALDVLSQRERLQVSLQQVAFQFVELLRFALIAGMDGHDALTGVSLPEVKAAPTGSSPDKVMERAAFIIVI
jgi:hypothetical protein